MARMGTLGAMSYRLTLNLTLVAVVAACLVALPSPRAAAAPAAVQAAAADRAAVDRAVRRLEAAQRRSERVDARIERTSAELDRVVADQQAAQERLSSRAREMYRSGDTTFVSVLLGAATFQEFASRWDLLTQLSRQSAEDLHSLEIARVATERSAESLLELQEEEARAVDAVAREVARARKQLGASQAALADYEARTAAAAASAKRVAAATPKKRAGAAAPKEPEQPKLTGSGAWQKAVASHYGRTFTGRGASGAKIGPYSMIVAHKTLPFGTLIEFEYGGTRAVARVADRGPHSAGRTFDLGPGVVRVLGFNGVHEVRYRIVKR